MKSPCSLLSYHHTSSHLGCLVLVLWLRHSHSPSSVPILMALKHRVCWYEGNFPHISFLLKFSLNNLNVALAFDGIKKLFIIFRFDSGNEVVLKRRRGPYLLYLIHIY